MDQHTVLKEIKQSKNDCEAFFDLHFKAFLPCQRGVEYEEGITPNESEELQKRIHSLWEAVKAEKEYIDGEINAETEKYRGMVVETKTHLEAMKDKIGKLFSNINVAGGKVTVGESNLDGDVLQTGEGNNWKSSTSFSSDGGSSGNAEVTHHLDDLLVEPHELERVLRKSIDAKSRLENIKKGLLFLKAFPSVKKNMNELFLVVKNVQLAINEKIKKALMLHSNMLYINEHEEIISYFKIYVPSIDVCIYSAEFFDDFFGLLNSILSSSLSDSSGQIDLKKIVHIYVQTFVTYLKFVHMYVYSDRYVIGEITKKIVHFLVGNFRKTFFKFTQSDSGTAVHNAVINYYEYFTTFIEEHQEAMRRLIGQLCTEVSTVVQVGQVDQVADHQDDFFLLLYKEAIQIVGHLVAEQTKQLHEDKSGVTKRKGTTTHKIMDGLSISVNILSNSPFLIGKKNMLSRILNEASFMSNDVMAEHVVNLSDASHFDMHCFEEVNTKVSTFDRNDIMEENKLQNFFTQLEGDITKIIQKKKKEINSKEIFNSPFFKFIPFFSFTFNHDTEFLLLFINVYNFVYEIIYNMKDQMRRKEDKEKRKRKSLTGMDHGIDDDGDHDDRDDDGSRYVCMRQDLDSSKEVIQYVKTAMTTFIQILNTFVNITKLYESFGMFLFERTYSHFTSRSLLNTISKSYLNRQGKYPTGVDVNISHMHAYFEKGDFPRRESTQLEEGCKSQPDGQNTSPAEQEASSPNDQPPREADVEVQLDEHECGKHLLKSSLCKLNDIKNTIIKNVIHFALIPLCDYTNRYTAKVGALRKEDKVTTLDPDENICFIVETIFLYIHIFHEYENKYLTELLFEQIADMFLSSVGGIPHVNETLLRQLQADTQYFINVCKRLKVSNYKPFFLFSCSLSFVLTRGNREENRNDASDVRTYLNDYAKQDGQEEASVHPFGITSDDAATVETHVTQLLSSMK
ncbi:Uncharacterized protein PCOAH_00017850 [Plasmodium coatneyi]|uniref:Uncharacterized protein n=1 Tax=Plasmodium coatneyi TaxID=208452 RepID=A0A1B1DXK7_9APIC|nr:Uncharacterized protein PCOAH_00017850 [Plasmodium coatneyi]ANQ07498.1 Uncharacterized protein PCOAH_00017850 [Plasmodium coatneyi]